MTLPQIHQRLDLFKEYLEYFVDNWQPKIEIDWSFLPLIDVKELMRIYNNTGVMFYSSVPESDEPVSFDEWLNQNCYAELSLRKHPLTPNKCYEKTD